jgi:thiosulfate/3-mercaptopyruvate sulfurtransferase
VLKVFGHESATVVNGGEAAILKAGLPLSADATTLPAATYTTQPLNESLYASKDEVKAAIDGSVPAVILDVRSTAEYEEGAIPTAKLYPPPAPCIRTVPSSPPATSDWTTTTSA